jgi:hypothetical protein
MCRKLRDYCDDFTINLVVACVIAGAIIVTVLILMERKT